MVPLILGNSPIEVAVLHRGAEETISCASHLNRVQYWGSRPIVVAWVCMKFGDVQLHCTTLYGGTSLSISEFTPALWTTFFCVQSAELRSCTSCVADSLSKVVVGLAP